MSTDIATFQDLTLYDLTDQVAVLARCRDMVTSKMPELTFVEGSYEAAILEVMANMVVELAWVANRIPRAVVDNLLIERLGITRNLGLPAKFTATLTIVGPLGATVPAGSLVSYDAGDGNPVQFTLDANVVIAPGSSTGTGSFTCTFNTSRFNGTASGISFRPVESVPALDTVVSTSTIDGGVDVETIDNFRARGVSILRSLRATLVTASDYTNAALQTSGVARATTIDRYTGTGGPPYTSNGHVTVVVRGSAGNLTSGQKTALTTALQAAGHSGITVHVIDPTITSVAVVATVKAQPGQDATTLQTAVQNAILAYINPTTWPWAGTVYFNDIVYQIASVPGVLRVTSLTLNAGTADVTLSGDGPLATVTGTPTITVT